MAQNDNFISQFLGKDFQDLLSQIPGAQATSFQPQNFQPDVKILLEAQRKNAEAFSEALKLTGEGVQACAQRCSEIVSQLAADQSDLTKEFIAEGTLEEKLSKQADLIKKRYDKSVSDAKELSNLLNKSNQQASEVINKRVGASLNEFKSALANGTSASKAKKRA